jgi:hypothetical protein
MGKSSRRSIEIFNPDSPVPIDSGCLIKL